MAVEVSPRQVSPRPVSVGTDDSYQALLPSQQDSARDSEPNSARPLLNDSLQVQVSCNTEGNLAKASGPGVSFSDGGEMKAASSDGRAAPTSFRTRHSLAVLSKAGSDYGGGGHFSERHFSACELVLSKLGRAAVIVPLGLASAALINSLVEAAFEMDQLKVSKLFLLRGRCALSFLSNVLHLAGSAWFVIKHGVKGFGHQIVPGWGSVTFFLIDSTISLAAWYTMLLAIQASDLGGLSEIVAYSLVFGGGVGIGRLAGMLLLAVPVDDHEHSPGSDNSPRSASASDSSPAPRFPLMHLLGVRRRMPRWAELVCNNFNYGARTSYIRFALFLGFGLTHVAQLAPKRWRSLTSAFLPWTVKVLLLGVFASMKDENVVRDVETHCFVMVDRFLLTEYRTKIVAYQGSGTWEILQILALQMLLEMFLWIAVKPLVNGYMGAGQIYGRMHSTVSASMRGTASTASADAAAYEASDNTERRSKWLPPREMVDHELMEWSLDGDVEDACEYMAHAGAAAVLWVTGDIKLQTLAVTFLLGTIMEVCTDIGVLLVMRGCGFHGLGIYVMPHQGPLLTQLVMFSGQCALSAVIVAKIGWHLE